MPDLRVALVPVGKMDGAEVEEAAARVSKVIRGAVEVREPLPHPKSAEDATRGQYGAPAVLAEARGALPRLGLRKTVGGAAAGAPPAAAPPAPTVLVTDLDLYAPARDWVLAETDAARRISIVSVRRLREAFYRRKADPGKQRARLAKEILRAVGRLRGLPDCGDPACAMAATLSLADVDRKGERYCAGCWKRLSTGAMRI